MGDRMTPKANLEEAIESLKNRLAEVARGRTYE